MSNLRENHAADSTKAPVYTDAPADTDELLSVVYDQLRDLARHRMVQERPGQTLQPTALVHEVYLRLTDTGKTHWENRAEFFAAAATAMRRILVERARQRVSLKRGAGRSRVQLDELEDIVVDDVPEHVLALNNALALLEETDPEKARIVSLRYFAGMTVDEVAAMLDLVPRTVYRHWRFARAWLANEMDKYDKS